MHVRFFVGAVSVIVACSVGGSAFGQEPPTLAPPPAPAAPTRAMTLSEAVAFARAHQPQVRAALSRLAARKAEAEIPGAQWDFQFGATAQLIGGTSNNTSASYDATPFVLVPRIGGTSAIANAGGSGVWKPYASSFVGVAGFKELFDFGRIAAQTAAAEAFAHIAKYDVTVAELEITFAVEEAYFAVLMAKSVVKASGDAYDRSKVHRDMAKSGKTAGMLEPIQLTRAEADLTRFDVGRVRAEGGLALAQSVFAATVGVTDSALDAGGATPPTREMPSLVEAVQRAQSRDPRILEMIARLRAEEASTRAIGAEMKPDVIVTGLFSGRAGGADVGTPAVNTPTGSGFIPYIPNYSVGIVLSWPLFEPVVLARKRASEAREQARKDDIALARFDQVAAIRQAYAAVYVAQAALPALERAVEAARANYAQADARFRGGLGTAVELADAEALRADSEIQLAEGQFEVARARTAFGRAIAEGF